MYIVRMYLSIEDEDIQSEAFDCLRMTRPLVWQETLGADPLC